MGYKLPDGRYVDDQGKTWKNYNDAAAAATTRQRRAETEAELSRQRQLQLNAANKLEQGQLGKRFFGWVPGVGAMQDRRMAEDARAKASADLAVHALQKQLAIHKGQMGEAPMPGAVEPGVEPAGDPPAPGLGAPDTYGDPPARARESEQRRMMQQYASKEYWDTEQGKAMLSLGQQMSAPADTQLADYYGAQRAVGIGSMDEILSGLASVDDRYKEGGDLRQWAQANQALALREYNKRFPGGTAGMGEGELAAPTIDTANPTAGERALMEAKVALHGTPAAAPAQSTELAAGGYVPDDRVLGINAQGQTTVGEGAYGFDPAIDEMPIAPRPVPAEVNRAEAGSVVPVEAQKANELVERYKRGLTRGQLVSGY